MRPLDPALAEAYDASLRRRRRARPRLPGRDRRSVERVPIANTRVESHAISGRVLDLSRSGMAIESTSALNPGQCYTLTLSIGSHLETLEAEVLWCRLTATERLAEGEVVPVYRAGIRRSTHRLETALSRDGRGSSRPSRPHSGSTPSTAD